MKKLFTLLTLIGLAIGASAQTTIFSWEGGDPDATVSGGTVTANNAGTDCTSEDVNIANATYHVIRLRGAKDYSTYVVVFTLDKALMAGDQIKVTAYRNKNAVDKGTGFLAKFDKGGSVSTGTTTQFVNIDNSSASEGDANRGDTPNTITLDVPAAATGSTTITATRANTGTNLFITKVEIIRTSSDIVPIGSFSPASLSVTPGSAVSAPTLSILDDENHDISDKYTIAYSSNNTSIATVNSTTGELSLVGTNEGKATITATFTHKTDGYIDGSASYTVTVSSVLTYPYTWDFSTFGTSGTWDKLADDATNWAAKSSDTYQNNVAMNGIIQAGGVTIPETKFINFSSFAKEKIYLNKTSLQLNGKNLTISVPDLKAGYYVAVDFENPSGSESRGLTLGNVNETAENKLAASTRETRIFTVTADGDVTLKSTSGVRIYGIQVTTTAPKASITPAKEYTTYIAPAALDFTGLDIKAYVATEATASAITVEEVTTVPAGTALILKKGTAASYNVPVIASASASAPAKNLLKGSATASYNVENDGDAYVLSDGAFHPVKKGELAAGKAYVLKADVPAAAPELSIVFGNMTGIQNITTAVKQSEGVVFDLQGRKVAQPAKGLYIVNGKKVIIK